MEQLIEETYALIRRLRPEALLAFKQGATGNEDFAEPEFRFHSLGERLRASGHPEVRDGGPHERPDHGGPAGWNASFSQVEEPVEDQWPYHAVAAAVAGHWTDRKWLSDPAQYDAATGRISSEIPPRATAWFLNAYDDRGCVASSPHEVFTGIR